MATTAGTDADSGLESAPAPWTNKGEVYFFFLSTPGKLPEGAYAPLEANSYFASPEAGAFRGGAGNATVQVVRYTDSPVGTSGVQRRLRGDDKSMISHGSSRPV
jgi:hypothetical protein